MEVLINSEFAFLYKKCKKVKPHVISSITLVSEYMDAIREAVNANVSINDEVLYDIIKSTYFHMLDENKGYKTARRVMNAISRDLTGDTVSWKGEYKNKDGGEVLTNEEYVRRLGVLYNKILSLRKDDDYVVNQEQMDKLVEVLDFFIKASKKSNGKVEYTKLTPREQHGGVTATFIVFDVYGDDVQEFSKVIGYTSAVSIDATTDGEVCISVTIPNVFVHK